MTTAQTTGGVTSARVSLRGLVVRGAAVTVVGFALSTVMRLGQNLILARLLAPELFGVMAIVMAVMAGLQMLSDLGIAPAIVQHKDGADPGFLRTAWTVQVMRGAVLWIVATGISLPIAMFYAEPRLTFVLPVVALTALIGGFNSTAPATMERELSLLPLTLMALGSQAAGLVCSLVWAIFSPTIWALVVGQVLGALVKLVWSHALEKRENIGFQLQRAAVHALVHFGGWVFVSTLLTYMVNQGDRFIFGKTIPFELLGVYVIAMMFARMPVDLVLNLGQQVVFPAYAKAINAGRSLDEVFHRLRFPLCAAGLGLAAAAAVGGPDFISVAYDERYHDARWIMPLIAGAMLFQVLEVPIGSAMLAIGKPRLIAGANLAKLAGMGAFIPLGFELGGFEGALGGLIAAEALKYVAAVVLAARHGVHVFWDDSRLVVLTLIAGGAAYYAGLGVHGVLDESVHRVLVVVLALGAQGVVLGVFFAPVTLPLVRQLRERGR